MTHYGDPLSYAFGYALSHGVGLLDLYYKNRVYKSGYVKNVNDSVNRAKDMYDRTDIDAYEWRAQHSNDPIFGKFYRSANERDSYYEQVKRQEDLKKNTGYNWKDNAYPRSAFNSAFGNSVYSRNSPLFEVNDAIMQLYSGVRKW